MKTFNTNITVVNIPQDEDVVDDIVKSIVLDLCWDIE